MCSDDISSGSVRNSSTDLQTLTEPILEDNTTDISIVVKLLKLYMTGYDHYNQRLLILCYVMHYHQIVHWIHQTQFVLFLRQCTLCMKKLMRKRSRDINVRVQRYY